MNSDGQTERTITVTEVHLPTWEYELRKLPVPMRDQAYRVLETLTVFHQALTQVQAPVWMMQQVNSMVQEYGEALERVRPYVVDRP